MPSRKKVVNFQFNLSACHHCVEVLRYLHLSSARVPEITLVLTALSLSYTCTHAHKCTFIAHLHVNAAVWKKYLNITSLPLLLPSIRTQERKTGDVTSLWNGGFCTIICTKCGRADFFWGSVCHTCTFRCYCVNVCRPCLLLPCHLLSVSQRISSGYSVWTSST